MVMDAAIYSLQPTWRPIPWCTFAEDIDAMHHLLKMMLAHVIVSDDY